MAIADPVGAIERIFRARSHPVPYPTFMSCFNRLLKDPAGMVPHPPSEELKGVFRAVCMALDIGIADASGRGEDREREFKERIYPIWKQAWPPEEFKSYEDILKGEARQAVEDGEPAARPREVAEPNREPRRTPEKEARPERRRAMVEKLTRAALEAEGALRAEPATVGPETIADEIDETEHEGKKVQEETFVKGTAESLALSIETGQVPMRYVRPGTKTKPWARYRIGDTPVALQLVRAGRAEYLLLSYGKAVEALGVKQGAIRTVLAQLGYDEVGEFAFEKVETGLKHKVRFTERSTNLAEKSLSPFTPSTLALSLMTLHNNLVGILEDIDTESRFSR